MSELSKFRIAEYQLADAVELCNQGKYVSALALAGACHTLFENLLKRRTEDTSMKQRIGFFRKLSQSFFPNHTPSDKSYRRLFYYTRNSIKHLDDSDSETTTFSVRDIRSDALMFIRLAGKDMAALIGDHGYSCSPKTSSLIAAFSADTRNS